MVNKNQIGFYKEIFENLMFLLLGMNVFQKIMLYL